MDPWDPTCYGQFADERRQPFDDLLALLKPAERAAAASGSQHPRPLRAIDLGCGDGTLTCELERRLIGLSDGPVDLLGIDNSRAMVEACREHCPHVSLSPSPDLAPAHAGAPSPRFALGDIARFADKALLGELAPYDVVFSNAALHWVPDHPRLLFALASAVAPGGQLAVQMPANQQHVTQVLARTLAAEEPYAGALGGYGGESPTTVLAPEQYATLLHDCRFAEQHVRLQVYAHELPDADAAADWLRGTLLTAYQRKLPPELWQGYLEEYRRRLARELGQQPFLLTYNRLLLWARMG